MCRRTDRAFTIVELLVALGIAAILLSLTYQIFVTQRRGYTVQEEVAEMQQNARFGADELARLIKNIGNGVDLANDQPQLLYAGPYELVFNGDLDLDDTTVPPADGTAITSLYSGASLDPIANPGYAGSAETYQVGLVSEGVGARHFRLVRQTYSDTAADGPHEIALNLNMQDESGQDVPLFLYWGDFGSSATVTLWGDGNGDGQLDAAEIAALQPLTNASLAAHLAALTPPRAPLTLDQAVRRVEISVLAETRTPDPRRALNAGHRQTLVRSQVTPRNLWNCPRIDPEVPSATVTSGDPPPPTTYRFRVTQSGQGLAHQQVLFSLDKPAQDPDPGGTTFSPMIGVTDADGWVQVTVTWAGCAVLTSVLGTPGATGLYTLRAAVPSTTTDLGFPCDSAQAEIPITLLPAPPFQVVLVSPPAPLLPTCGGTTNFIVQVQDMCGTPVDLGGNTLEFQALNPPGTTPLGALTPPATTSNPGAGGWPFAVQVTYVTPNPPTWPGGLTLIDQHFPVEFSATGTGWLIPDPTVLTTIELEPQPAVLAGMVGPSAANDCAALPYPGTFQVQDCHDNLVSSLSTHLNPTGFQVEAVLHNDILGPEDQGTAAYTGAQGGGNYGFVYTSPACTLPATAPADPPVHRYPDVGLILSGPGGTQLSLLPPTLDPNPAAPSGSGLTVDLSSCATCAVSVGDITPCATTVPVNLAGCQRFQAGETVELEVTTTGNLNAYFDVTTRATTLTHTFTGAQASLPPPTLDVTLDLYVVDYLIPGPNDSVTVTAYFPNKANALWSCSSGHVPVSTRCNSVRMFTDYRMRDEDEFIRGAQNFDNCLATVPGTLYFQVDDCQPTAQTVQITVESIVQGVVHSRVTVDLTWDDSLGVFVSDRNSDPALAPVLLVASDIPLTDRMLTYPQGENVTIRATYSDPVDQGDVCTAEETLVAPLPICFPNAITSGGGGNWDGNFRIHWGDVVIRGTADPAASPKAIRKPDSEAAATTLILNDSTYGGSNNADRFFDIYVGRKLDGSEGTFTSVPSGQEGVLQPFLATGFGNYYQNISYDKITRMMRFLDYDQMKALARGQQAYWYAVQDGSSLKIRNPKTGFTGNLATVLDLTNPNPHYDGKFIFVDAYGELNPPPGYEGPAWTGLEIDSLPLSGTPPNVLPRFDGGSQLYTEGIIYIAGSFDLKGPGKKKVQARTPPQHELRYDHNDPNPPITEADLPIRSDPTRSQISLVLGQNNSSAMININGGLYVDGEASFSGGPTFFGAVTAERGFASGGSGELWYNYDLNVTGANTTLCVLCCDIELDTLGAVLAPNGTVTLTASRGPGDLDWSITNKTVAEFSPAASGATATVKALGLGVTTVVVRDENNCVATARVEVVDPCTYFQVLPPEPQPAGWPQLAVDASAQLNAQSVQGSSITWSSGDSSLVDVGAATGVVTARDAGASVLITASDATHNCSADTLVQPVCPAFALAARTQGNRLFVETVPAATAGWSATPGLTLSSTSGSSVEVTPRGATGEVTATYRNAQGAPTTCTRTITVTVP